ncbi:MAG: TIGR04283 family arsenosugar biosynthesis glycosyltransferase [Gammaproteobacteria bacterium]|nr:TIGR04283 family arsenosugar biosynthesis glycosyltransferase [Gammaproteobacteria bacterium]
MFISIIIPTLNEEDVIQTLLQQLQTYRQQGHEVIVVDGGSHDNTRSVADSLSDKVISSEAGRALQMNNGATQSRHEALWFLHADTLIPETAIEQIQQALNKSGWGRFNVKLSGSHILFRIIETMMNVRSCVSGIATGDQGIFVKRKIFGQVNEYSNIPLMEDVDLSRKLKKLSKPVCLKYTLMTSSRRWEKNGISSTILLMWKLRFLYWVGVSPEHLARQYR